MFSQFPPFLAGFFFPTARLLFPLARLVDSGEEEVDRIGLVYSRLTAQKRCVSIGFISGYRSPRLDGSLIAWLLVLWTRIFFSCSSFSLCYFRSVWVYQIGSDESFRSLLLGGGELNIAPRLDASQFGALPVSVFNFFWMICLVIASSKFSRVVSLPLSYIGHLDISCCTSDFLFRNEASRSKATWWNRFLVKIYKAWSNATAGSTRTCQVRLNNKSLFMTNVVFILALELRTG